MTQRAGVILQFLAAGIIAVRRIGAVVQNDEAGNVVHVTHTNNDQRVAAHIISEAEPRATNWIVYLEGTLGPPAPHPQSAPSKSPARGFLFFNRDSFALIATELWRQSERKFEVGADGGIAIQKCNRSAAWPRSDLLSP